MQQIINFLIRNKTFLLYILLLSISLVFTIQSHSYHKSRFINSANFLSGGIYNSTNNISEYFNLKTQNTILQEENNNLRMLIHNGEKQNDSIQITYIDSTSFGIAYKFTPALVIKNSYSATDNILLLNKGERDSIKEDFGVITPKGILGIIDQTSKKFSTVISILNTNSRISAKLKHTNHFGSLIWNGKSPYTVQLKEIPKIAPVTQGDTITTSGLSAIFPKGIPIGTVTDFSLDNAENYYTINVKLFNDMTNIEHVYIIENKDKNEINNLLNPTDE
ncbi:rod shape-determining protein MreC [Mangrovimonas spongiae]|uniref:Cell shape-determining protein MreC n=1 Tax=Mangrovimonas spongiae TaxID=2494697 RepID=A0A428K0N5_9FLAO|nr:rod shape-determining protein MreC [Mangrovimonas spongiae]RSK39937.1 rod shape-determining protein MreC [Mangrovimonas spongiae]